MHTFIRIKDGDGRYIYVVGCWGPSNDGTQTWNPMRDCDNAVVAARCVNYLNGGEGTSHRDWARAL